MNCVMIARIPRHWMQRSSKVELKTLIVDSVKLDDIVFNDNQEIVIRASDTVIEVVKRGSSICWGTPPAQIPSNESLRNVQLIPPALSLRELIKHRWARWMKQRAYKRWEKQNLYNPLAPWRRLKRWCRGHWELIALGLFVALTLVISALSHAADLNLEMLDSIHSGALGARVSSDFQLAGPLYLEPGIAKLPGSAAVDLTPTLRFGESLWFSIGAGPAYATDRNIDHRPEGTHVMFHDEARIGYKSIFVGYTHYSNGVLRQPNPGEDFFTLGIQVKF
jgi:hypothetical protein